MHLPCNKQTSYFLLQPAFSLSFQPSFFLLPSTLKCIALLKARPSSIRITWPSSHLITWPSSLLITWPTSILIIWPSSHLITWPPSLDPNGSCLFASGSPTDTVGSQNFQPFSTRQTPHLGDWWSKPTTTTLSPYHMTILNPQHMTTLSPHHMTILSPHHMATLSLPITCPSSLLITWSSTLLNTWPSSLLIKWPSSLLITWPSSLHNTWPYKCIMFAMAKWCIVSFNPKTSIKSIDLFLSLNCTWHIALNRYNTKSGSSKCSETDTTVINPVASQDWGWPDSPELCDSFMISMKLHWHKMRLCCSKSILQAAWSFLTQTQFQDMRWSWGLSVALKCTQ